MDMLPIPPSREADARNRMSRTFWQGLLIDIVVMLTVTVGPLLISSSFAFTKTYWVMVGTSAAKTIISSIVSYFARKLVPPEFDPARTAREATPTTPTTVI
jgi:hypothetical protein